MTVARHRRVVLSPLSSILDGYSVLGQSRWGAWRRRSGADHLPADFDAVVRSVMKFADPALDNQASERFWDPVAETWKPSDDSST